MTFPKYVRISLTEKCPMKCPFCHNEGSPERTSKLTPQYWERHISELVEAGVQKVKFVGGEPLLYNELPTLIRRLRQRYPDLDLSLITAGSIPVEKLDRCFDAGLSRANMSIHGWQYSYFQRNSAVFQHYKNRQDTLQYLLEKGSPLKLNYVYTGPDVEEDLRLLLQDMQQNNVVINVLDDLSNQTITPRYLISRLSVLLGKPTIIRDRDPNSLDTLHLNWGEAMSVEIKDQHLGAVAPWKACTTCPVKSKCTEGIYAVRMYANGQIGLCMDRKDLRWKLSLAKGEASSAVDFVSKQLVEESICND